MQLMGVSRGALSAMKLLASSGYPRGAETHEESEEDDACSGGQQHLSNS